MVEFSVQDVGIIADVGIVLTEWHGGTFLALSWLRLLFLTLMYC